MPSKPHAGHLLDADDDMVLELAFAAGCRYIETYDSYHRYHMSLEEKKLLRNSHALNVSNPPSMRGKFPARLHVLLARNTKVSLVIRRGPSKSVCTVMWNRERDTFKLHELRHESTGTVLAFPEWEWADFVDGRLVFASEGRLCFARLRSGKFIGEKVLHDFNGMKFEAIAAPY